VDSARFHGAIHCWLPSVEFEGCPVGGTEQRVASGGGGRTENERFPHGSSTAATKDREYGEDRSAVRVLVFQF